MASVSVKRRVRPLRFAFLVDHRSATELRRAIQVNTILWGGMFNAIIPIFKRTPASWQTTRTAGEIVSGYLEAFEPDFVILGAGVTGASYGVAETRTASLDGMLTREGLSERGLDVMSVYRWRYQKEFRFVQLEPTPLHSPVVAPSTGLGLMISAVFGDLPPAPLEYFEKGFRDLGGETIELTAASYRETLTRSISPLRLGASGIQAGSTGPHRTFFLLDPTKASDIIDFWNLRALGWRIVAIPLPWAEEMAPQIAETVATDHQPGGALLPWVTRANFLKGRSVSEAALDKFVTNLGAAADTIQIQSWLPRVWEAEARESHHVTRVQLSAREDETKADVHEDTISFDTIGPEFMERSWFERPRVANVIELRSNEISELANIIPADMGDLDGLLRWIGRPDMIRNSSEGIAVLTDGDERGVSWRLPHGLRVFAEWLKPEGVLELSGAGKIARRMIRLVGGPESVRVVNDVELVRLISKASETASRDVSHSELMALLMKLHNSTKDVVERRIAGLVRRRVMKLGMRLQCEQCAQQNWFALDELRDHLTCQWCLDDLPFPTAMPPKSPCWSYRPLGPFAAKGHAQGAYVVAAAISMFHAMASFARTTWVPSFTLKTATNNLEADFGMLWERSTAERKPPQLVLGECKTFDHFDAVDIKRMSLLAKTFPRAVLVFATFNDKLTSSEKKLLEPFARWGRKNWRSPVMILTARELTSDFGLPFCWHDSKDESERKMYEELSRAPAPRVSLRRFSDATQQLRLGMDRDADWPHYDKA